MKKLLREPLVHFLLLGAGLFLVDGWASRDAPADQRIVVSAGRIEQLTTVFAKTWQRPPTEEELRGLIDDFVLEEVYYREAVAMELDRDDTIIRRRMRQKLEFLTDDMASLVDPSDEELAAHLAANEEEFLEEPSYTFAQIYFDAEGDGPSRASAQLAAAVSGEIPAGKGPSGDASLLPRSFERVSRREVDATFGTGFSQKLDELDLASGEWRGPLRSGLGLHLVRLGERTPQRLPELAEIREQVGREWAHERRAALRRATNERLLADYEVVVEWPEDLVAEVP